MANKKKEYSYSEILKMVLKLCFSKENRKNRNFFFLVMFFIAAWHILTALNPIWMGLVLNALKDSISAETLTIFLIIWTGVFILSQELANVMREWWRALTDVLNIRCTGPLFQSKIDMLFQLPALTLTESKRRIKLEKAKKIAQEMNRTIGGTQEAWMNIIYSATATIALVAISPFLALFLLGMIIVSFLIEYKVTRVVHSNLKSVEDMGQKVNVLEFDALDNLDNIRSLAIWRENNAFLTKEREAYFKALTKHKVREQFYKFLLLLPSLITRIVIVIVSVYAALKAKDVGMYVMIGGTASSLLSELGWVPKTIAYLQDHLRFVAEYSEELAATEGLEVKYGKKKITKVGALELKDVVFAYPESQKPVLNGVNLTIQPHTRVAIIGNSGAGKSTLINVLQHAYEIQGGAVTLGGVNMRQISQKSLAEHLTYIGQNPVFWMQKSIKENMLIFNPKASDKEIEQAFRLANIWDDVQAKEKGLNALPDAFSTGQKQRLSMARAILRHTPMIILDEPTANLDSNTQEEVLQGLKNLTHGKEKPTIIFASNVPAEIASAERIILLENGKVVENDTTANLMANPDSKTFKRLKKYKALFEG